MHSKDAGREAPVDADAISARIGGIRAGRGYVHPSHAVLAATHPDLLAAYEVVFSAVTFRCTALTPLQKHFIWLLTVGALEIPLGRYHVRDFVAAGGTARQVEVAAALAALVIGARALDAVGPGWKAVVPEMDAAGTYERAVAAIASSAPPLPDGSLDAALAAANACRGSWDRFGRHLKAARTLGVSDAALAEALSVTILPAGNPVFVQACSHWRDMVEAGAIGASPELRHAFREIRQSA
jgi:alkylhydroperoxidase/carboxymuconolactone decarboxylase family protein YurZ